MSWFFGQATQCSFNVCKCDVLFADEVGWGRHGGFVYIFMVVAGCEECTVVELGDIYKSSGYGEMTLW